MMNLKFYNISEFMCVYKNFRKDLFSSFKKCYNLYKRSKKLSKEL